MWKQAFGIVFIYYLIFFPGRGWWDAVPNIEGWNLGAIKMLLPKDCICCFLNALANLEPKRWLSDNGSTTVCLQLCPAPCRLFCLVWGCSTFWPHRPGEWHEAGPQTELGPVLPPLALHAWIEPYAASACWDMAPCHICSTLCTGLGPYAQRLGCRAPPTSVHWDQAPYHPVHLI